MDFLSLIIAVVVILYFWYRQQFLKKFELAEKLPGPKGYPILGNALEFIGKSPPQILKTLERFYEEFKHHKLARLRVGPAVLVLLSHPTTAEVILSSQKFIEKSDEYHHFKDWLATGLLTSTGSKWFARRKVITPTFHFKILDQFVEVFDRNSKVLVKQLTKLKGQSADIFPFVTLCALDVICGKKIKPE
jgi:cytochrome P450